MRRIVDGLLVLGIALGTACGAANPPAESGGTVVEAEPGPPLAPPPPLVPVDVRRRTLVTQAPEEHPVEEPGVATWSAEVPGDGERVVSEDQTVPEPRAVRGQGGTDGLDHDDVREIVRDHQSRFRHCFERLRQEQPNTAEARITVRFSIASAGRVQATEVVSSVPDEETFVRCIETLVKALDFPSASSSTEITYPFAFSVAAGSE